jgi:hypothetical protein
MASCEMYAVSRLIERFDYDGAIEILDWLSMQDSLLYHVVLGCQRSMNFNFSEAEETLDQLSIELLQGYPGIIRYANELPELVWGHPHYIFNELLDNIIIQLKREAYTDFSGRIFQLRELLYKFAVIQFREKKDYSLRNGIYQKQAFEGHFKIRHGLMNGMREILRQGGGKWQKIVNILSGKQMGELMDLRHQTIVAHGIKTITRKDIERIYQSPDHILDDLDQVFQFLSIPLRPFKYQEINADLVKIINQAGGST